ncbi:MAG TPA: hypothetical protein VN714_03530 [Trebonia sp.]|jgi:hypothetical protein|nr:hypothetical protein [Trebonia sp.]
MLPLPWPASGFSRAIALKELSKSLTDNAVEPPGLTDADACAGASAVGDELAPAGAKLLLELLDALQPAATSTAAKAAVAVSPARAGTENNGVPRSLIHSR